MFEFTLVAVVFLGALFLLRRGVTQDKLWVKRVALFCLALVGWRAMVWYAKAFEPAQQSQHLAEIIPPRTAEGGYVTSRTCRACHEQQYESWHKTYHRAMTQVASPDSVLGDFNNVRLEYDGESYHLQRRGDQYWVRIQSTAAEPKHRTEEVARKAAGGSGGKAFEILMTTGSHHYQVYWLRRQGVLATFPFVYLLQDQRWVDRNHVFLGPPEITGDSFWEFNCVKCHTTRGRPGSNVEQRANFAELGIACEACHGPGAEHVAHNRNPVRRYQLHLGDRHDDTILQPADKRLSARHASEVCGQCHSVSASAPEDYFIPGTDLENAKSVIELHNPKSKPYIDEQVRRSSHYVENMFWPDGQIRVTGREFNDLKTSPCYQGNAYTCLSCHQMHGSDPNDQLAPRMETDEACFQCHQEFRGQVAGHTHHPSDSAGSRCYNCHMPHTNYGLLKATRNHRVTSPSVANTLQTDRPNACNLCHLDKSLDWTGGHLSRWFGQPESELNDEQKTLSSAVVWLLRGDANQRALLAWAIGWEPAREISGDWWMAPHIAQALNDRYPALRYVAGKSMRRLAGFADVDYDFEASELDRLKVIERVMEIWRQKQSASPPRDGQAVLIEPDGSLNRPAMQRLIDQRDNRPVNLLE